MIPKGQTILEEKPYVFVINSKCKTERCHFCFQLSKLKTCSRCGYTRYCGVYCQKSAWSLHKLECVHLRDMSSSPDAIPDWDWIHLLARLILKSKEKKYEEKSERQLEDLMSHLDKTRRDMSRMPFFKMLFSRLQSFFGDSEALDYDYVLELYGKMYVNYFGILSDSANLIGMGLYLNVSIIDHSCEPNVVCVFNQTSIVIRSIADIPTNIDKPDWNKIKISYIDLLLTARERKVLLERTYFFTCNCQLCTNIENDDKLMNSMRCINSDCKGYVPVLENCNQVCTVCKKKVPKEKIKNYKEIAQLSELSSFGLSDINSCVMILDKQKPIFYKYNIRRVRLLDKMFQTCYGAQKWDLALKYGLELIPLYTKFFGLYHTLTGQLCQMTLALFLRLNIQDSRREELFRKTSDIFLVIYGRDHPVYKDFLGLGIVMFRSVHKLIHHLN